MSEVKFDVVVVGSGNAGFCAAHAAAESGCRVLILEKGPPDWLGGNTYFTAAAIRTTHDGLEDLRPLLDEPEGERLAHTHLDPYSSDDFIADMRRLTLGRCDPELTRAIAENIADTLSWLRTRGIRFELLYNRQSFKVDGYWRFWGGLAVGGVGGGKGLISQHKAAAEKANVEIRFNTTVDQILRDSDGNVTGVASRSQVFHAGAVVLASGGFEANTRMRAQYLGPNWDLAKVRGTPHNTGMALIGALEAGAATSGHWSGCHAVAWDAAAPETGNRSLTHLYTKQSYPIGLIVNAGGERFIDEGADLRNYTYAKYGAEILRQPGAIAFQLFDAKTAPLLRQDEYEAPGVSRFEASTIRELAERAGIEPEMLERTVESFNSSIGPGEFNPAIKDGLSTASLIPPKSNWALPLDSPPFLAFAVTCGITFTFGGLRINNNAQVLDLNGSPVPRLFAAGETVGGIFFHNYPGGTGLSSGAVFGRRAGQLAAEYARSTRLTAEVP